MGTTPAIVVIGATGFTGRLIAAELVGGEAPLVLAARDPTRLERLASELAHRETRVVDVTDPSSLERLIGVGDVVVNTAGPFAELGEPVIQACIDRRAHYLDTAGEQPFMRAMHQRYDHAARRAGSAIVNAMAFEFALGDCAAAVLARGRALPLRSLDVAYAWGGGASSRGTRRTIVGILGRRAWSLREGHWHRRPQGAGRRRLELASGRRLHAIAFGAGEVVTVPRHTPVDTVRGWAVTGATLARLAPLMAPSLPVVVPPLRPVLERLVARAPDPTPAEREADAFTIR
ncbi:MAG: NAD(P)H-binding protein, partial [Gemmatimonadetes bacterium]|nr:NAD(P)H-binding protein [Gemmatimonadota bacterium]NIQ57631.1 NAD(P)H-binding protein [Gemmatimonadota bacterium]NIU77798.1 NAD(P)H-binding protein [Gammaproteobacteria bacterium]NIX46930.1 NAD(P)H-binding protein [Gemmatimonadota bacterium]NIY11279.1 NAD(P)H-binding protein [Gemmatimonadota bacterium]